MVIKQNLWKHFLTAFLCIFLVSCSGAGSSSNPSGKPTEQGVKLIDFTGLDKIEVEDWINKNSVDRNQVYYAWEYSETVQQGRVIRQSIPAGTDLGQSTVTVTLSNGPDPETEITLIDFTGMSAEDIQKWFMNEHFQHVSVEYVYDPTLAPGTFIGTNAVNGKALRTDPIVVKIAGDPEQAGVAVTVPDMTGWNRGQAEEWANRNQVTIDYTVTMDASVPAGNIISFSPQAGTEIVKGDHMSAVVSGGSQVEAADFTGSSREDIDAWGQQNGITISYIQCWNASAANTIIGNQPNSGVMRIGDIMNVYVSVGPIPVQSYVGLSYQNNFMGWLNSINSQYNSTANLNVSVSEQSSDQDSGVILSQSPSEGYINPGDTISLVVSKYSAPVNPICRCAGCSLYQRSPDYGSGRTACGLLREAFPRVSQFAGRHSRRKYRCRYAPDR